MKLTLNRTYSDATHTKGELLVNGKFLCYTLEDTIRTKKIKHETCIDPGTYIVVLTLSQRFKTILPLLQNVPNFEGIRIHAGNTKEDTSGCILVGNFFKDDEIHQSKLAMAKVLKVISEAIKQKEIIEITINNPVKKPIEVVETKQETSVETPVEKTLVENEIAVKQDTVSQPNISTPITSENIETPKTTEVIQKPKFNLIQFVTWIIRMFKNL